MAHTDAILTAGGLVPVKTKVAKESTVDSISARIYRHDALGGRPVVRLTADGLAQGDDLAMEFLGFDPPSVEGPVALRRRQALGFPGWALIHDPDHARYALELVKEFRKEARRAKSKPGHAYDAFVDIARRLDRSVAHFLPSYWEQVGREFMQVGNSTYASRAFGKAREAEKVHSLDVDETLRKDAFLEFALAGCLSNKALTEYCKDLQQTHEPAEAWQFFRELCVRRTLGGMPPWTSMLKELGQLIKAAGLDVDAELQSLLKEIIESPAMNRAAMGFWKSCSKTVQALASQDDHVAGALLNLLPETTRWDHSDVWKWVDFLEEWGLLENAWKEGVSTEAGPRDGAAKWLKRLTEIDDELPQRVHDLLRSMADRMRQEGEPLNLAPKDYPRFPVDLLDLALELKVPVTAPPHNASMCLSTWAAPPEDAVDRPRDPVHVYADQRYRKVLESAVPDAAGNDHFEKAAEGKTALAEARKAWLLGEIASIGTGALPKAAAVLDMLEDCTARAIFQEFPEAYEALKKVDLQPALQRTIQGGLLDEYGWPALEEVVERLDPDGKQPLKLFRSPPHVVVSNGLTLVVVGPAGVVLEHEAKLTKKQSVTDALYLDGQLLVVLENDRWDNVMYWSGNPKKKINIGYYYQRDRDSFTTDLESGGTFTGHGTVHAGDESEPNFDDFLFDGEHFWRLVWHNDELAIREVNAKGDIGRKSLPPFLEEFIKEGMELNERASSLMSLGDAVNSSPLGCVDGLVGWRVRAKKTTTVDQYGDPDDVYSDAECEGIDGRSWKGNLGDGETAVGLIDWPGTSERLPVCPDNSYGSDGTKLWDASGELKLGASSDSSDVGSMRISPDRSRAYDWGQVATLHPSLWHALVARDEKSSKKLRTLSAKQTKTLYSAAVSDLADQPDDVDDDEFAPEMAQTDAAVAKWLSSLKSERLGRGLKGVLYLTAGLSELLERLLEARDPAGSDEEDEGLSNVPNMKALYEFFTGQREAGPAPAPAHEWFKETLDGGEVDLLSSYWLHEGKLDADRYSCMETSCDIGFPDLPGQFRHYDAAFSGKPPVTVGKKRRKSDDRPQWGLYRYKGNCYAMWRDYDWQDDVGVLEYAPNGKFQLPSKAEVYEEELAPFARFWSSEQTQNYVAAFRDHDELPWPDNDALQAAADQLGVTAAEVALVWCGFPNVDSWETNFLPKGLREGLGLKVKEASAARKTLQSLKDGVRPQLLNAFLSGPPEDLWEDGGRRALDRLVEAWSGSVPKRLDVPPDIFKVLDDAAGYGDSTDCIAALADPRKHPRLAVSGKWQIVDEGSGHGGDLQLKASADETFDTDILKLVAVAVPLLYSTLPAGSEATRLVAIARDRSVKCLGKPGLLFLLGSRYFWEEGNKGKAAETLKSILGKTKKKGGGVTADDGIVVGAANEEEVLLAYRPAKVKTEADVRTLRNTQSVLYTDDYERELHIPPSVDLIRSEAFDAICERITSGTLADGQFESNPLASARELVSKVASKHNLGEDAAVLYLQLLTLHDPTTANLKKWNDWTAARINKAAKELTGQKLILQAKRARAGRNYFIPGGWEALKSPHLPIESWKLPLYRIEREAATGRLEIPLCRILPLCPIPDLFATAWNRTLDGDAPQYEEVK